MSTLSSSATYHVLTSPHFFSLIAGWTTGWPGLVLQRWRAFLTTRRYREPTDDLAFTKMLVALDDRRALQLVLQAVWRRLDTPASLQRFRFRLDDAVAVGDAHLVRRTFDSNVWISRNVTPWTWFTAVAYFTGDCAILELIHKYASPSWTESRVRSQLFRRDLYAHAMKLFETVDVACLQWFVDTVGPTSLPSQVVCRLDHRLARHRLVLTRHVRKPIDRLPSSDREVLF